MSPLAKEDRQLFYHQAALFAIAELLAKLAGDRLQLLKRLRTIALQSGELQIGRKLPWPYGPGRKPKSSFKMA
ncbi:MAG: hypothetical protein ACKO3V_12250 [Pirellula sp.]